LAFGTRRIAVRLIGGKVEHFKIKEKGGEVGVAVKRR
jgi:hypothetical protein